MPTAYQKRRIGVFVFAASWTRLLNAAAMLHTMGQALTLPDGQRHQPTRYSSLGLQPGLAAAATNDHAPVAAGIGTSTSQALRITSMPSNKRRSHSFLARVLGRASDAASDRNGKHLIVLVNGLWGSPSNWTVVKEKLIDYLDPQEFILYASMTNTGLATYSGIDICGQRLAGTELRTATS